MKSSNQYIITIFVLFMTSFSYASSFICDVVDKNGAIFQGKHRYKLAAKTNALHFCKSESPVPRTCRNAKDSCIEVEEEDEEIASKSDWQCLAFDQMGKEWSAPPLKNRDEAAIQAKENCLKESGFPDTCYVNLLTCKDINAEDF